MIEPKQVFIADAKPFLALPVRRSAYVFGAASPLGEALLNQLLALSSYKKVYVSTTSVMPASVAHLHSLLAHEPFAVQDEAQEVDCIIIVNELGERRPQNSVYASLFEEDVPALIRQLSSALPKVQLRYLLVSPALSVNQLSTFMASYSTHAACMVYGLVERKSSLRSKGAYQFQPQADSWLDRVGAWVLNVLSNAAHSMLNSQSKVPLTVVKIAQRIVARFNKLPINTAGSLTAFTPEDLID